MKKILRLMILTLVLATSNCLAMTFSQPVEIGHIGFPVQAPYHGFIIEGATYNNGSSYNEDSTFKTYIKGIAQFGNGIDALYCNYNKNEKDFNHSIKFGGNNNYVISIDGVYKDIFKINNNKGLALYMIYRLSGSSTFNIIGKQKNGKWVSYIDSRKIADIYFNGVESYKGSDGVFYEKPICRGDTIVVSYKYFMNRQRSLGEMRFKWDDAAQWFGVEQITY